MSDHQSIQMDGPNIQPVTAIECLKPKYIRERSGSFEDTRLSLKLASIKPNTLVFFPDGFREVLDSTEDTTAELVEKEEFSQTRRESRTNVRFGQLVLTSGSHGETAELVGVKYNTPGLVAKESAAARKINNNPRLSSSTHAAFIGLGFITTDSSVGLISRYQHNVVTLDNLLWNTGNLTIERIVKGLGKAARWMAPLHSEGIVHGDAQSKNIAIKSNGQPHYPDLETAEEPKNFDELRAGVLSDIETFITYQNYPLNPELIREHFTRTYLEILERAELVKIDDIQTVANYDRKKVVTFK